MMKEKKKKEIEVKEREIRKNKKRKKKTIIAYIRTLTAIMRTTPSGSR